jgi:hypothetical protein
MTRRSRILAVALALCAEASSGCGGTQVLAPARPRLGVQSNAVVIDAIELRVRPEPGARWIATSEAVGDATVLGQEVHFEYASTSERVVRERRADGTTVLAERRLGGAMRIAMGETPAREEAFAPEPSTRTTVMDARGRTIEDALFAAPAPLEDARTQAMRRALEPIVDALKAGDKGVTPLHWEIEFPEVFSRDNPGFDRFGRWRGRRKNGTTTKLVARRHDSPAIPEHHLPGQNRTHQHHPDQARTTRSEVLEIPARQEIQEGDRNRL